MDRRDWLSGSGALLATLLSGCLSGMGGGPLGSRSATENCPASEETDLVSILPPSPAGFERTVDEQASSSYLEEYRAVEAASAEYADGDDAVLDDPSVRAFRFREGADPEAILRRILNNIEFDSGRAGVGVLHGRVGVIAVAVRRERAGALLTRSPSISERCLRTHGIRPSETVTPDQGRTRTTEAERR